MDAFEAIRQVARRERERAPGFALASVNGESSSGLVSLAAGTRDYDMTQVGGLDDLSSSQDGETVLYLSGPMPAVVGRSPFYRGR